MTRQLSTLLGLAVLGSACTSPNTDFFGADVLTVAREAQNPVSKLTKVGLESNATFNYGPDEDDVQYVGNIDVTLPTTLDDDFNIINVIRLPVISQPEVGLEDSETGLGNLEWNSLIAIDHEVSGIFAFGPIVRFPTNTDDALGPDDLAAGITVVMVRKPGNWVVGLEAGGIWNVPGDADDQTNELLLEPLINYNLDDGWYWTSTPAIFADFDRGSSNRWMLPIGGGIGRVVEFGAQPVNFSLQAFWNAEHPEPNGGDYAIVFDIEMLYTKRGWRGK